MGIKHSPPRLQSSHLVSVPSPTSPHTTLPSSLPSSHIHLLSILPTHQALSLCKGSALLFPLPAQGQLFLALQVSLRFPSSEGDGFASLCIVYIHTSTRVCTHIHTTRSSRRAGTYLVGRISVASQHLAWDPAHRWWQERTPSYLEFKANQDMNKMCGKMN